jgi:hypothetical protein
MDYKFIVEDFKTFSIAKFGDAVEDCHPNLYLYGFLQHYLGYLKKEIQAGVATRSDEKVQELQMLGLLLWNYFFSRQLGDKPNGVVKDLFSRAQKPGSTEFGIAFNGSSKSDNYNRLPWELLFWPEGEDAAGKGSFLFHNENIRLTRMGNIIADTNFQVDDESVRILLVVTGLPAGNFKTYESEEGEYRPLQYAETLTSLKKCCGNIKSNLLVKINGLPSEQYIDGSNQTPPEVSDKKYVDILELKHCIKEFRPHVIHLITHGDCDADGNLTMVFNEGDGGIRLRSEPSSKFEDIFTDKDCLQKDKPKLVFLQVCQSGQSFLPLNLSRNGVLSVIAIFYDINQILANKFSTTFYELLLGEKIPGVSEAFHKSRLLCTKAMQDGELGFGLPIIYYNIAEENQSLIKDNSLSKTKSQIWAEGLNAIITQHSLSKYGSAGAPTPASPEALIRKIKLKASNLINEEREFNDTRDEDVNKILQDAINKLFSNYIGPEYGYLREPLESLGKELSKSGLESVPGRSDVANKPLSGLGVVSSQFTR